MTKLQDLKAYTIKQVDRTETHYSPQAILKLIEVIELQRKVLNNYHHSVFHKDRILLHEANDLLEEL